MEAASKKTLTAIIEYISCWGVGYYLGQVKEAILAVYPSAKVELKSSSGGSFRNAFGITLKSEKKSVQLNFKYYDDTIEDLKKKLAEVVG